MSSERSPVEGRSPVESRDTILANNLLVARQAAGLTQQQLAEAADVSRATIAQIEAGLSDPRLSTIVELSHAVGISPVLLLSGLIELSALAELTRRQSGSIKEVGWTVPPHDLRMMSHWAASGMVRDRLRAARTGAAVVRAAGGTLSAVVGAAIGSAIQPGDGTVTGAIFAELSSGLDVSKGEKHPGENDPAGINVTSPTP